MPTPPTALTSPPYRPPTILIFISRKIIIISFNLLLQQSVSPAAWTCLRNNGFSFGVVRAYEAVGLPDPRAAATGAPALLVPHLVVSFFFYWFF
jgi:hypothetical protein